MEAKLDKLYDLVEKMYIDLKGDIRELQLRQDRMQGAQDRMQGAQDGMQSTQEKMQATQEKMQATQDKMQSTQEKMQAAQDKMQATQDKMQAAQDKFQITQEQMQSKLELMAEIQLSHYEENKRSHGEIIRRLERVETAVMENEAEIYKLKRHNKRVSG